MLRSLLNNGPAISVCDNTPALFLVTAVVVEWALKSLKVINIVEKQKWATPALCAVEWKQWKWVCECLTFSLETLKSAFHTASSHASDQFVTTTSPPLLYDDLVGECFRLVPLILLHSNRTPGGLSMAISMTSFATVSVCKPLTLDICYNQLFSPCSNSSVDSPKSSEQVLKTPRILLHYACSYLQGKYSWSPMNRATPHTT